MNPGELVKLRAEIQFIAIAAAQIQETMARLAGKLDPDAPQEEVLMALGLNLQHYYSALEDIMARIVAVFDQYKPSGPEWHKGLMELATVATGYRPPILDRGTYEQLDEYRRFHHLVRKAYLKRLEWGKMQQLVEDSSRTLQAVQGDLKEFDAFMTEAIADLEKL